MRFSQYLGDKLAAIVLFLSATGLSAAMLLAFGLQAAGVIFVELVLFAAFVAALILGYMKRARFYHETLDTLEHLDKKTLITEILDRPDFLEGKIIYDTLALATKNMNDTLAQYRLSSEEYRTYIETWVHEIKTPIAAAHLTIENNPGTLARTFSDELNAIERFVEQALYFSRSANVENDYSIREVTLREIVNETLRRNQQTILDSKMRLEIEALDITVYTDIKWMTFILGQLISNAIKYSDDSQREPTLSISAQQLDAGLSSVRTILTIKDNGRGIPPEDVPRVFLKGFTGANGRIDKRSTGIGLYLCKQLCDKMGLDLQLASIVNEGTQVTISFPQNKLYFVEHKSK